MIICSVPPSPPNQALRRWVCIDGAVVVDRLENQGVHKRGGNMKQMALGIAACVFVLSVAGLAPSPISDELVEKQYFGIFYIWLAVEASMYMFIAALVGAYVARTSFIGAAVLIAAATWGLSIWLANLIAVSAGQSDLGGVALSNVAALILPAASGIPGAVLGRRLGNERGKTPAEAT